MPTKKSRQKKHDLTIVCSDGINVAARRSFLVKKSDFFSAMFQSKMIETITNTIFLQSIKSTIMHFVLQFIHTGIIKPTPIRATVDIYCAADFLLMHNLTDWILEQADNIRTVNIAVSLLNQATVLFPWDENTKKLFDVLLKPFCVKSLVLGDLNELSENALELMLTKSTREIYFNTSEYDLLLCVIEWAYAQNSTTQSVVKLRAVLRATYCMSAEPSTSIWLESGPSRASLLKMMPHMDLSLICNHRLKHLSKFIKFYYSRFPQDVCTSTACLRIHQFEFRGKFNPSLKWDQPPHVGHLIFSVGCTAVECPSKATCWSRMVQTSTPCVADSYGKCQWKIIVESMFVADECLLGLFKRSSDMSKGSSWVLQIDSSTNGFYVNQKHISSNYGHKIEHGDEISFCYNFYSDNCDILINGREYGHARLCLSDTENLYPAVIMDHKHRYRIKCVTE